MFKYNFTTYQRSCEKVMFSVVSASSWGDTTPSNVTITHNVLDLIIQASHTDMFKLVQLGPHCTGISPPPFPCPQYMFKPVHYEAHTVGKRAVDILLECFIVCILWRYFCFLQFWHLFCEKKTFYICKDQEDLS